VEIVLKNVTSDRFMVRTRRMKCKLKESVEELENQLTYNIILIGVVCLRFCKMLYFSIVLQLVLKFIFGFVYCPPCNSVKI
jgi:hypothetical protein